MRSTIAMFVLLACAGCATSSPEQIAARNEQRCIARGYQPKTDAFADCLTRVDGERDTRMQQRHREEVERSGVPGASNRGY